MTRLRVIIARRPIILGDDAIVLNVRDRKISRGRATVCFPNYTNFNVGFQMMVVMLGASVRNQLVHHDDMIEAVYGDREDGGPDDPGGVFAQQYIRLREKLPNIGLSLTARRYGYAPQIIDLRASNAGAA